MKRYLLLLCYLTSGPLNAADEITLRFSADSELRKREVSGFTFLLNSLQARRVDIIKSTQIDPGKKSFSKIPFLNGPDLGNSNYSPSYGGYLPALALEGTQCSKIDGVTLRSAIGHLSVQQAQNYYRIVNLEKMFGLNDLIQLNSSRVLEGALLPQHKAIEPKDKPAFFVPPGLSGVLEYGGVRGIEVWNVDNSKNFNHVRMAVTFDFSNQRSVDDLFAYWETVRIGHDNDVIRRNKPRAESIPDAHEILVTKSNGFFVGALLNGQGKLANNAPITTVRSDAEINHPFFSCLQCHGTGRVFRANKALASDASAEEYKNMVSETNEKLLDGLKEAGINGSGDLYEYYAQTSRSWSVKHLAEEFMVGEKVISGAISKMFPKRLAEKYLVNGVPFSVLFQTGSERARFVNDAQREESETGFCRLARELNLSRY